MAILREVDPVDRRERPAYRARGEFPPYDQSDLKRRYFKKPSIPGVKRTCVIMGTLFIAIGLIGLFVPRLMGSHLSLTHNLIHIISGAISVWVGKKSTSPTAAVFALTFGAVYGLLGLAGFVMGDWGMFSDASHSDRFFLPILPGRLELGTMDHIIHVVTAIPFLVSGFSTRRLLFSPVRRR